MHSTLLLPLSNNKVGNVHRAKIWQHVEYCNKVKAQNALPNFVFILSIIIYASSPPFKSIGSTYIDENIPIFVIALWTSTVYS